MKSFFEFYDLLKKKKMNEQDGTNTMAPPNMGMGAAPPGGMMTPADPAGGGMDMSGMNMPTGDMGDEGATAPEEGKAPDRNQTAPPEGMTIEEIYPMVQDIINFVTKQKVDGDEEKQQIVEEDLLPQLNAIKNNLARLTGKQPPDDKEGESDASAASNEIPTSPDEIPPGTETAYGGTFGDAAGGGNMFPSNGSGSGDMGGNMAGGSTPGTTGPGALGFGGFAMG